MSRIVRELLAVVVVVGAGISLAGSGRAAEGDGDKKPCTIATKGDSPVAKACAQGGFTAGKASMKDLVKKAKAAGTKFECDECHSDPTKYTLTSDANEKFKKLLAAAGGGK